MHFIMLETGKLSLRKGAPFLLVDEIVQMANNRLTGENKVLMNASREYT